MPESINLSVNNLKIGMFVCKLDRDWLGTPFPLEGVWINSPDDIEQIKLYCNTVWVDTNKSWLKTLDDSSRDASLRANANQENRTSDTPDGEAKADEEADKVPFAEEIVTARSCYSQANDLIRDIMTDIESEQVPAFEPIKTVVTSMLESIHRNSDALLWLTLLKDKHSYTYQHCLDNAIHMMNFGKFLGLPRGQQHLVGVAGLLQDVGKMRLPIALLNKQGKLTADERKTIQKHVQYSLEIVAKHPLIHRTVKTVIEQHHERFDGRGYPVGLKGTEISMFGAMASIVDTYNAMLSERPGGVACSSFQAITTLHEGKGTAYHPALVERFIQCVGVYSPGTIVELNTGELALVIEQNKTRRLCPKLLAILDSEKNPYANPYVIDMLDQGADDKTSGCSIKRIVEPENYNIDLKKYYL